MNQKIIYFDVADGGYAEHGAASPTVAALGYLKGITESLTESSADQYANGEHVGTIKGAAKITGELVTTARDSALESLVGLEIGTDVGVARTIGRTGKRVDIHYSYKEQDADGTVSVVKVWLFNVELGKPTRNHETKTDSVKIGDYAYPYTAYGVKLKAATGTADYVDANGLNVLVHDVECRHGEDNYSTFFGTVPSPKYVAPSASSQPPSDG